MLLEAVLTFLLVFVVFATASTQKARSTRIRGFAIGLTITMDIFVGGSFHRRVDESSAHIRPRARRPPLANHGVYWVGPLFGGVIAGGSSTTRFSFATSLPSTERI